ncbi:MAG: carboxypeptidase-like regulatory domain-containing protein, partial [Acidimicrobiales bacterium]
MLVGLVVVALVGVVSPSSALAAGVLGGSVVDAGSVGVPGVTVDVFEATWGVHVASTSSGGDGLWSVGVPAGSYRVRFTKAGFAERWSGGGSSWVSSSPVVV